MSYTKERKSYQLKNISKPLQVNGQSNKDSNSSNYMYFIVFLLVIGAGYLIVQFWDEHNLTISLEENSRKSHLTLEQYNDNIYDVKISAIKEKQSILKTNVLVNLEIENFKMKALNRAQMQELYEKMLMEVNTDIYNSLVGKVHTHITANQYLGIEMSRKNFTNTSQDTVFLKFSIDSFLDNRLTVNTIAAFQLVEDEKSACPQFHANINIFASTIILEYCNWKGIVERKKISL